MSTTVVTGTFGPEDWITLAHERAFASVPDHIPWIHAHRKTLHEARNAALRSVETEWVIHLDADDELSSNYIEAMGRGTTDVRAPIVCYVEGAKQRLWKPHVAGHRGHMCQAECLEYGNWIVVGAMVRTELVRRVGGWRDYTWSEDYDLWCRCYKAGATFGWCVDAVYRAHVRRDSRNRGASRDEKLAAHRAIATANDVVVP